MRWAWLGGTWLLLWEKNSKSKVYLFQEGRQMTKGKSLISGRFQPILRDETMECSASCLILENTCT